MFSFLVKRTGEDDTRTHAVSQGRLIMSLLWPVFAPIVFAMWVSSKLEEIRDRERRREWHSKARVG